VGVTEAELSVSEVSGRHPFIPQQLAVKSMRDNGYKNTSYALAELIDNSYQAIERVQGLDETHVGLIQVIVVEGQENAGQRNRQRPQYIAVFDNGCGMTAHDLRRALQFGNGSHLNDREGIGRFGMGLPNSSVSQCRRADVWSWKTGYENAIHSFLDLNSIESGELEDVPFPDSKPIPPEWLIYAPALKDCDSGTLVVWSDLDRVKWRTAKSTLANTEALIGRIYRKLISRGLRLDLTLVTDGVPETRPVRPNDPLYLMRNTSTPAPFDDKPMFQPYGKDGRQVFRIEHNGQEHEVVVTLSYARDEARVLDDGSDAGHQPYGKHARSNIGVSVVRADRELSLETAYSNLDLRERWWGAEVSFPPSLDEVFGVTNNKQYATHFTEMAEYYLDSRNDDDWSEIKRQWEEQDDPQRHLVNICNHLVSQIERMRVLLREQTKGQRSNKQQRHDIQIEKKASEEFKKRRNSGNTAEGADEITDPEQKRDAVERDLKKKKYTEEQARKIATWVVDQDLVVIFVKKDDVEIPSFFTVDVLSGVTEVVFNTAHPAYDMLISVLEPAREDESVQQLKSRLEDASGTLKLILAAWARYEAEEKAGDRQARLREIRGDWGRMARSFLKDFHVNTPPPDLVQD
jgi:hypothetical protein